MPGCRNNRPATPHTLPVTQENQTFLVSGSDSKNGSLIEKNKLDTYLNSSETLQMFKVWVIFNLEGVHTYTSKLETTQTL